MDIACVHFDIFLYNTLEFTSSVCSVTFPRCIVPPINQFPFETFLEVDWNLELYLMHVCDFWSGLR